MNFRTEIKLTTEGNLIDYYSNLLFLGSCFSENIFQKFNYYKFNVNSNPFGILYNPLAIEKLIINAIEKKEYNAGDIFYHNERWQSFDAHSSLSNGSKKAVLTNLNNAISSTNKLLKNATHIFITLGTSRFYNFIETNQVVGNCHKLPASNFTHQLLSISAIVNSLNSIHTAIKKVNRNCSIIFTVSPVRHIKDGFIENTLSKAHLISAIHQFIENEKDCYYFPSFEIMMDDLRDYRFYNDDLLHPNQLAIDYIWEKLKKTWVNSNTLPILKEVENVQKGMAHKPFNPNAKAHKHFSENLAQKKHYLKDQFNIQF